MNQNGKREMVEAALKVYAPVTAPQLAEHMGLTQQGVWWHLKMLHDAKPKRAYVIGYRPQIERGRDVYVWAAGDCQDAKPEPKRRGPVDRKRVEVLSIVDRDEELERQEETRVTQAEERQRQKMLAEIKPFRDPLIWALFEGVSA